MDIRIVGAGCNKYFQLLSAVKSAMEEKKCLGPIKEVNDRDSIIETGVINCPALIINGKIICQGEILNKSEILKALGLGEMNYRINS